MVDSIAALKEASQRFDQAVMRTTAAARGLSEPNSNAPDLPSSIVDLATSARAFKAVAATVAVSKEMDSAVLDIVA